MAETKVEKAEKKAGLRTVQLITGVVIVLAAFAVRSCSEESPTTPPSPDTRSLAELLTQAESGDGIVRLGKGTYDINVPLVIPEGVTLIGKGAVLRATAQLSTMVLMSSESGLKGISIEAGGLSTTVVSFVPDVEKVEISDTTIVPGREARTGISLANGGTNININNTRITDVQNAITIAGQSAQVTIADVTIRRWTIRGIQVQGTKDGSSKDLTIDGANIGPNVGKGASRYPIMSASTGEWHESIAVRDSVVRGRGQAHDDPARPGTADQISITKTRGVEITGNESTRGGERGINVSAADDVLVQGNRVSDADGVGIGIGAGRHGREVTNVRVVGNTIANSGMSRRGTTPDASLAGIRMTFVSEGEISGNTITTTSGSAQRYGISIDRSPGLIIRNNTVSPELLEQFIVGSDADTVRE